MQLLQYIYVQIVLNSSEMCPLIISDSLSVTMLVLLLLFLCHHANTNLVYLIDTYICYWAEADAVLFRGV
jgi:hypothetical protein